MYQSFMVEEGNKLDFGLEHADFGLADTAIFYWKT